MSVMLVEISKIRRDGGTQSRAEVNRETVIDYAAAMKDGDAFPPVKLFYDGKDYWLADGFHRIEATIEFGSSVIKADVHQGTQRDAILDSVGANSKHGLRRSRDDMRRAIQVLLKDNTWSKWSDREIARRVGCDHKTVAAERGRSPSGEIPQTRTVERNGTVYEMTPATQPTATVPENHKVAVGDVVRFFHDSGWGIRLIGRIASLSLDTETVIIDTVLNRGNSKDVEVTTATRPISKVSVAIDTEYVAWFNFAFQDPNVITLYAWKDHYISLDGPYKAKIENRNNGYNWQPKESWDRGLAWRFHASHLDYWRENNTPFIVLEQANLPERMRDLVLKAARAHGGELTMPPQPKPTLTPAPAPEMLTGGVQTVNSTLERLPEWVRDGVETLHASGKLCRIETSYLDLTSKKWMLRVEIIKPQEGFANAPVSEFIPAIAEDVSPDSTPDQKITVETTAEPQHYEFSVGQEVICAKDNKRGRVLKTDGRNVYVEFDSDHRRWENEGFLGLTEFGKWRAGMEVVYSKGDISYTGTIISIDPGGHVMTLLTAEGRKGRGSTQYISELNSAISPAKITPEPTQKTVIKVGMKVLTRTGRPGEVLDIIGGIANVKSGSYTNPHKLETLKPVIEAVPSTAPSPAAKPILEADKLKALNTSMRNLMTFLESRQIPDRGDFKNDIDNLYYAMQAARGEYYKLLDPATGAIKK